MRTRYYDASLGRFLSRDVVLGAPKNPQTLSPYLYALSSPLRYVDPDGRWVWQVAGAVVGGCAGYALARSRGWGTAATVAATVVGAGAGALTGGIIGHFARGGAVKIAVHGAHHTFGRLGKLAHVRVNWWVRGVKGSGRVMRIPLPWR